jgi:hypothetical protein
VSELRFTPLAGPYNGLDKKIAFIKECYSKSLRDPRVRSYAEVTAGKGPLLRQAMNLFSSLVAHSTYLPDPLGFYHKGRGVGLEFTKSPASMMDQFSTRKSFIGDCDDAACLSYSMLQSIGIPAKIRVTWYKDNPSMPKHIYTVAVINGVGYPFDTTRKTPRFGSEAPYLRKVDF